MLSYITSLFVSPSSTTSPSSPLAADPQTLDEWVVLSDAESENESTVSNSTCCSLPPSKSEPARPAPTSKSSTPSEIDIPPSIPPSAAMLKSSVGNTPTMSEQSQTISKRKLKVLRNKYLNSTSPYNTASSLLPSNFVGSQKLALPSTSNGMSSSMLKELSELKNRELKMRKLGKLGMRSGVVVH